MSAPITINSRADWEAMLAEAAEAAPELPLEVLETIGRMIPIEQAADAILVADLARTMNAFRRRALSPGPRLQASDAPEPIGAIVGRLFAPPGPEPTPDDEPLAAPASPRARRRA